MKRASKFAYSFWRSGWWAYLLAVGLTLFTLWGRLWIGDRLDGPVLIIFTIPIILSGFLGGVGPGLLATFVAFLGASYYLFAPVDNFRVASSTNQWQQAILVLAGTIISFICEALHRSHRQLKSNLVDIESARDEVKTSLKETSDLRTALDAHAIVAVTDAQGKIVYVNDKFCAISKYSRQELVGQDHRIINSGFHSKEFIRDLWTTIAHGKVWHGEIKNKAKDGSFYWVDTTIVPFLNEDGKPRQYVAIRADITERKLAEEEIRQINAGLEQRVGERTVELEKAKHQAESANRFKSEFLANMSHELRTPLNGIIGFSEFLVDEKPGKLNSKQKEYLGDVLNSARHLHQLINDVLDLAKVEAGRMELNPEIFQLAKAIEDVCAVAKPLAQKKNIKVFTRVSSELDVVTLDQQKFKQVLFNLLSNALKFTDEGGQVEIKTEPNGAGHFRLLVKDTGIGIRPEDLQRLFREFEQIESGTSRRYEGTGLGLALSRKIVELQGGTIMVESEIGKGSAFSVTLPLVIPETS
jgi:PAS domain S-box-containing protein